MKRYSTVRHDHIEYGFWLVFSADGDMRFARGEPAVQRGERAMSLSCTLPKALFRTPELKATITIPEGVAPSEFKIDTEAASDALRQTLGVDIDLQIHTPE